MRRIEDRDALKLINGWVNERDEKVKKIHSQLDGDLIHKANRELLVGIKMILIRAGLRPQ